MSESRIVLARTERLTPADHQTHRRYTFAVPEDCVALSVHVRYDPKFVSAAHSRQLVSEAIRAQTEALASRVGQERSEHWAADFAGADLRVPNLVTASLDDSRAAYRGAGHRHAPDQQLRLGRETASPGFVAGPLEPGEWTLTLSVHTLVSDQCELEIQIGAEIA